MAQVKPLAANGGWIQSDRFGVTPGHTLFINDSAANIDTARSLGFETHLFAGADACLQKCRTPGLL